MTTTLKTCFKCGTSKPMAEFYTNPQMADGHLNKCKCCTKIDAKAHRNGPARHRVLAYERARAALPHRADANKKRAKQWRKDHPDRRRAQIALNNAVRAGRVTPLPCLICGDKAEAHHPDYDAPLDVVWLCASHHKQAHAA